MNYQEWDDLGRRIQDMVDSAISEQNYQKLSQTISKTVERAIDSGTDALKNATETFANAERGARAYETHKHHGYQQPPFGKQQNLEPAKKYELSLYRKPAGEKAKGVMMTVFGSILTGGMGLMAITFGAAAAYAGGEVAGILTGMAAVAAGLMGGSGFMLGNGIKKLGRLNRFQKYTRALGEHTYCNLELLSRVSGKPLKFVKKEIRGMINKGWFSQGHMDTKETYLITSDETYKQYINTQKQLEMRQQEQARQEARDAVSAEVQSVLDKGNEFLNEIIRCNDAIPGEEISEKISRMELIVQKIFERARKHPEIIPDLNRLMDYYLPMTVKLLHAYEDMDAQPIQGENIESSKREIEDSIDTLNVAFEKLLDSVFEDTALDVSSDISVLHTILAQEGLTEDEFTKMRKEAEKK